MRLLEAFKPIDFDQIDYSIYPDPYVWFLVMKGIEDSSFSLVAEKILVKEEIFIETIGTIESAIRDVLLTFPKVIVDDIYELEREKLNIARKTRRGIANTRLDNIYWYHNFGGALHEAYKYSDSPLCVLKRGDLYGIIKHPRFNELGFISNLTEYHFGVEHYTIKSGMTLIDGV